LRSSVIFIKTQNPPKRALWDMYWNARPNNNGRTGKHSHIGILANQDKLVNISVLLYRG